MLSRISRKSEGAREDVRSSQSDRPAGINDGWRVEHVDSRTPSLAGSGRAFWGGSGLRPLFGALSLTPLIFYLARLDVNGKAD